MARYSTYWRFLPIRMVREYKKLENDPSPQAQLFYKAISQTIKITELIQDGEMVNKAIKMVYIEKTHTIEGAARQLYVSRSKLAKMLTEFITMLAYLTGFTDYKNIPPIYRQIYRQTDHNTDKTIDEIQAQTRSC